MCVLLTLIVHNYFENEFHHCNVLSLEIPLRVISVTWGYYLVDDDDTAGTFEDYLTSSPF